MWSIESVQPQEVGTGVCQSKFLSLLSYLGQLRVSSREKAEAHGDFERLSNSGATTATQGIDGAITGGEGD